MAITVGIATRNRIASLIRCVRSLEALGGLVSEVIVADDASDEPVAAPLAAACPQMASRTRVTRRAAGEGYIAARNHIMRLATTAHVLSLDDDAYVIDPAGIRRAIELLDAHETVAAVAFAQAEADGSRWPTGMQPAPVVYPCDVAAFIGFAALIRRAAFLDVGGYREALHF